MVRKSFQQSGRKRHSTVETVGIRGVFTATNPFLHLLMMSLVALARSGNGGAQLRSRPQLGASRQIDCKTFEIAESAISQRPFMSGAQDDARRPIRIQRFLPALSA